MWDCISQPSDNLSSGCTGTFKPTRNQLLRAVGRDVDQYEGPLPSGKPLWQVRRLDEQLLTYLQPVDVAVLPVQELSQDFSITAS